MTLKRKEKRNVARKSFLKSFKYPESKKFEIFFLTAISCIYRFGGLE
jgi:hypothetical protein